MNDDMVEGDKINTKTAPRVFLGGGVEAGAWAAELEALGVSQGALIVSVSSFEIFDHSARVHAKFK